METTKAPLTEEQAARRRAGRTLARALWQAGRRSAAPATQDEAGSEAAAPASWKQVRKQQTKLAMKTIRLFERSGYRIEADEEAIARLDAARAERAAARAAARAATREGAAAEAAE